MSLANGPRRVSQALHWREWAKTGRRRHIKHEKIGNGTVDTVATLETTLGQIDGLFSQLSFKRYLPEVVSVGD